VKQGRKSIELMDRLEMPIRQGSALYTMKMQIRRDQHLRHDLETAWIGAGRQTD
jgi:hypothetical protein